MDDRGRSDHDLASTDSAPVTKQQANELLVAFSHLLGPFTRPFGYQAWGLAIDGLAVAVAVSGPRAAGFARREVVSAAPGSRATRSIRESCESCSGSLSSPCVHRYLCLKDVLA
ncbi:hypothetical protein E1287_17215 [Actinomadura sp. KC06]|uniref:hypothetical protein n=1 Tax=Actinomadura sp. KC06 TaxID=2530369 RepID=UPI001043064C|nr:hypothetical protein [Actinomadura sp. KC06]TDD34228.1 hypothetical protein E1287_17215 [Actinomadura sp. KC06]